MALNNHESMQKDPFGGSVPSSESASGLAAQAIAPQPPKENFWYTVLKVIVAIATALASAFGLQSCF